MDKEASDAATLTVVFDPYSHIGKGFCTLGGPNELFSSVAYFLSKVSFVAPSPHIMHQSRAGFIIAVWRGTTLNWGYLMVIALLKEIRVCQTCKQPAPPLLQWMGLLFRLGESKAGPNHQGPPPRPPSPPQPVPRPPPPTLTRNPPAPRPPS